MKFRLMLLCMVLVVAFAGLGSASAQDANANCLNLSESDCALVEAGLANFATLNSFSQSYTFSLSLTGMGAMDPSAPAAVTVSSTGSGPVAMTDGTPSLALDLEGSVNDGTNNASGPISFAIVGDRLYVQTPAGEWIGAPAEEVFEGENPLESVMGMMGSSGGDDAEAMALFSQFGTQERLADETVNGQPTAVFKYSLNLAEALNSPDMSEAMGMMGNMGGAAGNSDLASALMFLPMLAQFIQGDISFTRWVGVNDQLPYRVDLSINLSLDMMAMSGMMGAMGGDSSAAMPTMPAMDPIVLNMQLTVDMTGHNATAAPAAPAGAREVSGEEFQKLMEENFGSLMGGM
jgi:hypothetical protein